MGKKTLLPGVNAKLRIFLYLLDALSDLFLLVVVRVCREIPEFFL